MVDEKLKQYKIISVSPQKDEYIYSNGTHHIGLTPIKIGDETHWKAHHLETKNQLSQGRSRGIAIYDAIQKLEGDMDKSCKEIIKKILVKALIKRCREALGIVSNQIVNSGLDKETSELNKSEKKDFVVWDE